MADRAAVLDRITELHTLGPAGTNCRGRGASLVRPSGPAGRVVLPRDPGAGVEAMDGLPGAALLGLRRLS